MPKKNFLHRQLSYAQAINEAISISMNRDKKILLIGLGVDDPKRIFGTTNGLKEKFPSRVFDMPTSENAITAFSIGLSMRNYKSIITHQRVEFSLLSVEQIVNQAAKWHFMNAGQMSVPIVIRMVIGRGWGQGPQHSQTLEALYANIPGLKIVSPSTPSDAKGIMISSIEDLNPVLFFEHRWLHHIKGNVNSGYYKLKLGKSKILKKGKNLTVVTNSFTSLEATKAIELIKDLKLSIELIDLITIRPLDIETIVNSVKKTGKLLVVDNGWKTYGISAEILSTVAERVPNCMLYSRIGTHENSIPSSQSLAKFFYPTAYSISKEIFRILKINYTLLNKYFSNKYSSDQPDPSFTGPF